MIYYYHAVNNVLIVNHEEFFLQPNRTKKYFSYWYRWYILSSARHHLGKNAVLYSGGYILPHPVSYVLVSARAQATAIYVSGFPRKRSITAFPQQAPCLPCCS